MSFAIETLGEVTWPLYDGTYLKRHYARLNQLGTSLHRGCVTDLFNICLSCFNLLDWFTLQIKAYTLLSACITFKVKLTGRELLFDIFGFNRPILIYYNCHLRGVYNYTIIVNNIFLM